MAETDSSSKSDNSSSKSGESESQSRASEARDSISDKSKDTLSGKTEASNKNEAPSAKDLADGQQRMEDKGKEAKAQFEANLARSAPGQGTTAGTDPASTNATAPAQTQPDIPEDVSMCMHDVAAEKVTCVKNGQTFDVPFDGWAPNATEQSMVETMAIAEHHSEFRTAEHMTRLSNGADHMAGIRDAHLRQAATAAREPVAGRSEWENIAAVSGGVGSVAALARARQIRTATTETGPTIRATETGTTEQARIHRNIEPGERVADLENEIKGLTFETGREVAVVSLSDGRRVVAIGGANGMELPANTSRLLAHTHPMGHTATPSPADMRALEELGQNRSYIYGGGVRQLFGPNGTRD